MISRGYEKLFYVSSEKFDPSKSFDIEMAGITSPNDNYRIERNRTRMSLNNVSVFEYVISGKGYIESEGETYTVQAGDFYYLDRRHSHKYWADPEDPFKKIWINARGRLPAAVLAAYYFTDPVIVEHADVYELFRKIGTALSDLDETNRDTVLGEVAVLLTDIIVRVGTIRQKRRVSSTLAFQIKSMIDESPNFNITLAEVEKQFFLSKSYIIHLFSDEFNITPKQYILQKKIDTAKLLLRDARCELSEIADILHFSSVQHFSATFKRYTGMTPDTYRRSCG